MPRVNRDPLRRIEPTRGRRRAGRGRISTRQRRALPALQNSGRLIKGLDVRGRQARPEREGERVRRDRTGGPSVRGAGRRKTRPNAPPGHPVYRISGAYLNVPGPAAAGFDSPLEKEFRPGLAPPDEPSLKTGRWSRSRSLRRPEAAELLSRRRVERSPKIFSSSGPLREMEILRS